ncbi:MAG: Gfo/Idh/MocA family oxidoreductase [Nannocystaceae bacterium]
MKGPQRLGIAFVGSGFITAFHIRAWVAVRDADILGIWSPNRNHANEAARLARSLRVGDAKSYGSIEDLVADPKIHCIWICGPNHTRVENVEAVVGAIQRRRGELLGIACEKPLARNVAEARRLVELVESVGLLSAYLEDQLFSPALVRGHEIAWARGATITGRPYLARAAEEHAGPHSPWFWRPELQGGGVITDMMCHCVAVARFLLTEPGAPRDSIVPTKISAQIASLKWTRPEYVQLLRDTMGPKVDFARRPAEDFARATIYFRTETGLPLVAEATTSWSYVGAGLRLSAELLGPEYSFAVNSLDTGARVFFSRKVHGDAGEDFVEKQNAEQGFMPVVGNEAAEYGYEAEDRHFVQCFLDGVQPKLDFRAGAEVVEMLMLAYMSAEQDRAIEWKPDDLEQFRPAVSLGTWSP